VGGGEVVGQEKKGGNDDVVVAAVVDSTTVDDDHSDGGGGPVVGPETKVNDTVADAMVDDKNKSSVDGVSGKEFDSNEIDRMQHNMRKSLFKRRYKEVWGKDQGYQSPPIENPDNASHVTVNVDKAEVRSVDKDKTGSDDVDEDEDEGTNEDVQVKRDDDSSYLPGISLGDNDEDEDEDDAVGGNNNNADDVGEDKAVGDVIVAEDVVGGVETNTKMQKLHYEAWVNNYNYMVSFYNTNGHCIVKRTVATAEGRKLGNWVHDQRKKIKAGTLSDDRITLLSDLQFNYSMQTNVVEQKLTVPMAISSTRKKMEM
jgi:hypothetical protein